MEDFEMDDVYYPDYTEPDDYDILGGGASEVIDSGLSNADYNLDSPLNPDFINGVIIYLKTRTTPLHHLNRIKREVKIIIDSNTLHVNSIRDPVLFHHAVGNIFTKIARFHSQIPVGVSMILDQANEDSVMGEMYLTEFRKRTELYHQGSRRSFSPHCASKSKNSVGYFISYLHLHTIILIMNGSKDKETIMKQSVESRWGDLGITLRIKKDIYFVTSDIYGVMVIYGETVYWVSELMLLDKNMVLMLKDMSVGRFMTINVLEGSQSELISRLLSIFHMGDQLLCTSGNDAFDAIKMVEPICVQQWLKLASRSEYDRVSENQFGDHITRYGDKLTPSAVVFLHDVRALINGITDPEDVGVIFGSFRLWGHPFICYRDGLRALKNQCRIEKQIDTGYAHRLADDFAFMIIKDHYRSTGQWAIRGERIPKGLIQFVEEGRWPTDKILKSLDIRWADIEKVPIFEVPADIPISQLYSDKSFSMTRSELSDHLNRRDAMHNPIPSKRVLEELLRRNTLDNRRFAQSINDTGLPKDSLIIGLKEKERELKKIGRFFTLMSWELREYIVMTEFLIKKFYLPLFDGVTMSDGLTTVVKKMIQVTAGQSSDETRPTITYANHIDYEKWNNHQRGEAVNPVFRVMGEFFGLPDLFVRTHEFFENSLIYYTGRPDLIKWNGQGSDLHVDEDRSELAWNGQAGGLEGVRQKGWTIVGMLSVKREGNSRNTRIRELAQGDNQVIFTDYKLLSGIPIEEQIKSIGENNSSIMKNIGNSVKRLGLIINEDETFTSGGFTIYGKVPLIFGNMINLETKKWNRITCVTNDQIPTICNVMGVISSTALGSAQCSSSFSKQLEMYMYYSGIMFEVHNLLNVLHSSPLRLECTRVEFVGKLLFLDKSIGGYTGISPTRFLIRQFPDPITESLAFWKPLLDHFSSDVRFVSSQAWNPIIKRRKQNWIRELAENPSGLNIEGGSNIENIFKQEVKSGLIRKSDSISNELIKGSLELTRDYEEEILAFLEGINPCFPRFVAGFLESSVIGLADGVIGLIQNSRTMRNIFKRTFSNKVYKIVLLFEAKAMRFLSKKGHERLSMTFCSATRSDELRNESWGVDIIGQTVPHPYEFLKYRPDDLMQSFIGVGCPSPFPVVQDRFRQTGPILPYIGSKTSEDTSVLKTWEKELVNPLGRKAFDMMRCIDWFVNRDGNLSKSIMNNLETVAGVKESFIQRTSKRSGCPIHRFTVSRQSSGGFSSINPNNLRWLYVSAESWEWGNAVNMDFMHQSAMLYAQCVVSSAMDHDEPVNVFNRFYLNCRDCMREVPVLNLESSSVLRVIGGPAILQLTKMVHPDIKILTRLSLDAEDMSTTDISNLSPDQTSYACGFNQAFGWGQQSFISVDLDRNAALFPIGICKKVSTEPYVTGWIDGLMIISCLEVLTFLPNDFDTAPAGMVFGRLFKLCRLLGNTPHALAMFQSETIRDYLIKDSGWIPPSFPVAKFDMGSLISRSFLNKSRKVDSFDLRCRLSKDIIIFDELNNTKDRILLDLLIEVFKSIFYHKNMNQDKLRKSIRRSKSTLIRLMESTHIDDENLPIIYRLKNRIVLSASEIRHGLSSPKHPLFDDTPLSFSLETFKSEDVKPIPLQMSAPKYFNLPNLIRTQKDPTMSGLRVVRLATGSHYKLRCIIITLLKDKLIPKFSTAICAGDGSGGIGSMILRTFADVTILFNSLMGGREEITNGMEPQGPFAITCLPDWMKNRCKNLNDFWGGPSDLCDELTWIHLTKSIPGAVDLFISDMEPYDRDSLNLMIQRLISTIRRGYSIKTSIIKTHVNHFVSSTAWDHLANIYSDLFYVRSVFSSSLSSEIYVICTNLRAQNANLTVSTPVKEWIMHQYKHVWRDKDSEFKRMIMIKSLNMQEGVDNRLIPDGQMEFEEMLHELGISYKDRRSLSDLLLKAANIHNILSCMKSIRKFGMREHWKVKKDKLSDIIPTSGRVSCTFSILTGIALYLSICSENKELHSRVIESINIDVTMYTLISEVEGRYFKSKTFLNKYPAGQVVIKKLGRPIDHCKVGHEGD